VPELIKRMYDYRMAIENMRAEVTVTKPVFTVQPDEVNVKQHYFFAYDKGRVRCDITFFNSEHSEVAFDQHLVTPDFYFLRYLSGEHKNNDGNSLIVNSAPERPFDTFDPRRIGTDGNSFDTIEVVHFNYDTLLDEYYSPMGENYAVSIDIVDGDKLYKVSYQVNVFDEGDNGEITKGEILNSYWINPQKGYSLVRSETESEMLDLYISYAVTLGQFHSQKGEIWFPREILFRHRDGGEVLEEKVVIDSIVFDVQDETPFTFAGLEIPVGYSVSYLGRTKFWDGKEFVDEIPFVFEPVNSGRWKVMLIINAVILAFLALLFLYKLLQRKGRVRCDVTLSTPTSPQSQFYQYLSTPEFYFTRHTSPTTPHINDGNSLFVNPPLTAPADKKISEPGAEAPVLPHRAL